MPATSPTAARVVVPLTLVLGFALALACRAQDDEDEKVAGFVYCAGDSDCPSGYVCENDDTRDAYCTPTCMEDADCPTQIGCPSLSPVGKKCYFESGFEGVDRYECDQFQGYYGPNSCRDAEPGGDGGDGNSPECSFDSECSSSCSDCYGCRSGSCVCGYRGVSGACIF